MSWIDLHIDSLRRCLTPGVDLVAGSTEAHVDLPRLRRAGARGAIWAACDDVHLHGPASLGLVLRMFAAGHDLVERARGDLVLVRNREDWRRCRPGGPIGMILALEGAHALIGDVGLLEAFHGLGLRVLTLTWNHANPFGAGCAVAPDEDTGLTPLGHELLRRAQSLGILVDLAHASPRTLAATLASARGPCLVSHTACAALRAHRRNLSDAQLRAVAAAGGLIGIALYPPFLVEEGEATPATVALHVRHALEVAGPAAVAMGTDFDGITRWPVGLSGLQDLAGLAAALAEAGLDAATLEAVLWRNAARVLDQGLGD